MAATCPVVDPGRPHCVIKQQTTIQIFTATKTANMYSEI